MVIGTNLGGYDYGAEVKYDLNKADLLDTASKGAPDIVVDVMQELEDWQSDQQQSTFSFTDDNVLAKRASVGISLNHIEKFGYTPYGYPRKTPDGGPQEYYDLPPDAVTLNDLIEFKSYSQWLGDTAHLFNIFKAAWRWGIKEGTSKEYDARKFIYSGARLLMHYAGVEATRETLQKMLDDPQFNNRDK